MAFFYDATEIIGRKELAQQNAVLLIGLQSVTAMILGGSFGSLLKAMTGMHSISQVTRYGWYWAAPANGKNGKNVQAAVVTRTDAKTGTSYVAALRRFKQQPS